MLVMIKGAGDIASGIALRLWRAGINVVMTDLPKPSSIRRTVCFSEAVYRGETKVEEVHARLAANAADALLLLEENILPVIVDPKAESAKELHPDVIVHCAAWTAVDAAEDEANRPKVKAINVDGVQNIADAAKLVDAKMIYISTDYVFDGQGETPWQPDCKDYAPLNYYGETKLGGEQAVARTLEKYFIVRIAWVFGLNGKNFIKTMLNVGKTHDTVRVVMDQIGTPTYTLDLARLLVDMLETEKYGYYHATNEGGYISWYDFTKEIYRQAGYTTKVVPVTSAEYGASVAARPFNSRLDKSKLREAGFTPLPTWQDAVGRYLEALKRSEV